jgi:hypothetical protein
VPAPASTMPHANTAAEPVQQLTGEDGQPVSFLHLFAVREVGERMIAELAARTTGTVIDGTAAQPPAELADLGAPATE